MRSTTSTYKQIIASGETRIFHVRINLTLADETALVLTDSDIMSGTFVMESASSGESSFDIGSAIIGMCKFSLENFDERFTIYDFFNATATVWVKLEGDSEYIRTGFYTVDEPKYNGAIVSLELIDNMWKFDRPLPTMSFPITCGAAVNALCLECGVTLATQQFRGYDYTLTVAPEQEMNCREMLQYIAMICCRFCDMDSTGALRLRWYDTDSRPEDSLDGGTFTTNTTPYSDGDTADGGNFTNYYSGDYYDGGDFLDNDNVDWFTRNFTVSLGTDEITITGLKFTLNEVDYQIGANGYVLVLENPLVNESNVNSVLNYIWDVLRSFRFRTFNISTLPDISAEVGDCCAIKDAKENIVYSYITNIDFNLTKQTVQCNAVTPTRKLSTTYSKTLQIAVEEAKKKTDAAISRYDVAVQLMNNLAVNAMGAYQDYEDLETGGRIYYLSNKPITKVNNHCTFVADSTVFKATGDGFYVSTHGGQAGTWQNGYDPTTGTLLVNVLKAIGVSADWVETGLLTDRGHVNYWDLDNNTFVLSATTTVGGKTVNAIAQEKADAAQAAAENTAAQALAAQVAIYDEDIADLQDQIDGNITTWYYSGTPTLNNPPASTWTTTTDKDNHIGDIYYDSATGYAYRFMKDGSTYLWTKISDSDIEAALAEAQDAWDLADNKRRVFISQPVPPYDIGDMWVQGSNGDIKRCATAKTSSQTYSASDWVLASKYTDDTAVTNLDNSLTQQNVFDRLTDNGRTMGIYLTADPTDPTKKLLMINANYIQTGQINANLIKAGVIADAAGKFSLNMTTGALTMNSGMFKGSINVNNMFLVDGNTGNVNAKSGLIGDLTISNGELYRNGNRVIVDGGASFANSRRVQTRTLYAFNSVSLGIKATTYMKLDYYIDGSPAYIPTIMLQYQYSDSYWLTVASVTPSSYNTWYYNLDFGYINFLENKNYRLAIDIPANSGRYRIYFKLHVENVTIVSLSSDGIVGTLKGSFSGSLDCQAGGTIGSFVVSGDSLQALTANGSYGELVDTASVDLSPSGCYCFNSSNGDGARMSSGYEVGVHKASSILGVDTDYVYMGFNTAQNDRPRIYAQVNGTNYTVTFSSSDRRFKHDIKPLDTELSKKLIDGTETKSFVYNGDEGKHYGVIAQEARELLDKLGETDAVLEHSMGIDNPEAPDPRTIDYHEYIPHLINYVKELRAELNELKAELKELKEEK